LITLTHPAASAIATLSLHDALPIFIEPDETPDLSMEERVGDPGSASALKDAYRASRFGAVTPLYAERPFLLYLDGMVVGGRIDRSEEHTSELQSRFDLVCRLLLEKK